MLIEVVKEKEGEDGWWDARERLLSKAERHGIRLKRIVPFCRLDKGSSFETHGTVLGL